MGWTGELIQQECRMLTNQYQTPGVYKEEAFSPPAVELRTGVPAFLGFAARGVVNAPEMLTLWAQFEEIFGKPLAGSYLGFAVRGFFENRGELCYVIRLDDKASPDVALSKGLDALEVIETIDLVCAPDIMRPSQPGNIARDSGDVRTMMQAAVLKHCDELGDRFAILDSPPYVNVSNMVTYPEKLRQEGLSGTTGAVYFPWVDVGERDKNGKVNFVPPCGHIAGVYARSDRRVGVHKAPANEILEGVLDLEVNLTNRDQDDLNPRGVNCLRAFPGRGIRIWGARTLSSNPAWRYVNVRRLFLTAGRWIEGNMANVVFEPNDPRLWARITRELTGYFNKLFLHGALKGRTPNEAFYVKCDSETNSKEIRYAGMVVTKIGLAMTVPNEFIVLRIIHSDSKTTLSVSNINNKKEE